MSSFYPKLVWSAGTKRYVRGKIIILQDAAIQIRLAKATRTRSLIDLLVVRSRRLFNNLPSQGCPPSVN